MTCDDDGEQPLVFSVRFVRKAVGGQALKVTRERSLGRKCPLLTGVGGYAPSPESF